MSKILILVRHAQAESQGAAVKDFDRELLSTGMSEASRLGKKLLEKGINIDRIISSNAVRASLTAELIAEQTKFPLDKIVFDPDIYESSVRKLLSVINNLEESVNCVVIVGHNPVISYFAEYLVSEQFDALPPSGAVAIDLESPSWKEAGASSGKINYIEYPNR